MISKFIKKITLVTLLHLALIAEEPWGTDSDMISRHTNEQQETSHHIATALINFHQNVISPADGPRSHFVPSSSQYAKEAIQKYGFLTGYLMGCDRLMRENSELWIYPLIQTPEKTLKYDAP